jgi:hypothetical protein
MLDVILYGYDAKGHLTLQERRFQSLRELSSFFSSPKATRWQWAEVEISAADGQPKVIHYSADSLRAMIVASSLEPSRN